MGTHSFLLSVHCHLPGCALVPYLSPETKGGGNLLKKWEGKWISFSRRTSSSP